MKKLALLISLLFPVLIYAQHKKNTAPSTYDLLIGTYTKGKSKGIYVYRFYTESGRVAYLNEADDVDNPSYLCVAPGGKFVYAVNENGKDGGVSAFSFEPRVGTLTLINKQPSGGGGPCYISIDKDRKNVFVANYGSGSLSVLPVNKDGSLGAIKEKLQDDGHSINKDRQEGPHVHTAVLSPDEKYLLYTDLGTDKINIERYHAKNDQPLTPASPAFMPVTAGFGPRHLAFSDDKKHLYLVSEMGSAVNVYDYDNGKLKEKQSITLLRDGFKGKTGGSAIHISPDGKFLYASNRLETNEIIVYAIDPETGMLTLVEHEPSYGKNPRDFVIAPDGRFLLLANQDSDNIYIYRIDKETGKLNRTPNVITDVGNPVCLKFAAAE